MQRVVPATLLGALLVCGSPASASPIGVEFLFECGECTPSVADHFVGKVGPADYQLEADGYVWHEVDIEASTISFTSLVDGATRSPLVFRLTWSPAQYRLLDAAISPASSFEASYTWGPGELVVDLGGRYFVQGDQIIFDLTAMPIPEPGTWLLSTLGGAALLWRQRRAR